MRTKQFVILFFALLILALPSQKVLAENTFVSDSMTYTAVTTFSTTIRTTWAYPGTTTVRNYYTSGNTIISETSFYFPDRYTGEAPITVATYITAKSIQTTINIIEIGTTSKSVLDYTSKTFVSTQSSTIVSLSSMMNKTYTLYERTIVIRRTTYTAGTNSIIKASTFFLGSIVIYDDPLVAKHYFVVTTTIVTCYHYISKSNFSSSTVTTITFRHDYVQYFTTISSYYESLDTSRYFSGSTAYWTTSRTTNWEALIDENGTSYSMNNANYTSLTMITDTSVDYTIAETTITLNGSFTSFTIKNYFEYVGGYFVHGNYYSISTITAKYYYVYTVTTYSSTPSNTTCEYYCEFFMWINVVFDADNNEFDFVLFMFYNNSIETYYFN